MTCTMDDDNNNNNNNIRRRQCHLTECKTFGGGEPILIHARPKRDDVDDLGAPLLVNGFNILLLLLLFYIIKQR